MNQSWTLTNGYHKKPLTKRSKLFSNQKNYRGMNMILVQRMDELIQKLESHDEAFIEQLNADFEKYCENKLSRKRH